MSSDFKPYEIVTCTFEAGYFIVLASKRKPYNFLGKFIKPDKGYDFIVRSIIGFKMLHVKGINLKRF